MATRLISDDIEIVIPFFWIFAYFGVIFHLESCTLCQKRYHIWNQHRKLSWFSYFSNNSEHLHFFRKKYLYSPSGKDEKLIYLKVGFFRANIFCYCFYCYFQTINCSKQRTKSVFDVLQFFHEFLRGTTGVFFEKNEDA